MCIAPLQKDVRLSLVSHADVSSRCRLCTWEGLYHARLHAEVGEPLLDSVAASLLLPLPKPTGVARRGRVTGESSYSGDQQLPRAQNADLGAHAQPSLPCEWFCPINDQWIQET